MYSRLSRTIALTFLIGTGALAAAECGGGADGPTAPGSTSSTTTTLGGQSTTSTTSTSTTSIPIGSSSTWVIVFGDTGWCGSPGMTPIARQLDNLDGEIFLAGDLAYTDGRIEEFMRCFDPDFGRFKPRIWAAPGNHDYQTAGAAGYFAYFGDRAGPARRGYYAVRSNSWLVLMLDSVNPTNVGSPQYEFVRQQLVANATTRCTVAMMHHPFVSSGPNGPHPSLRDLWELLYNNNADLVVAAHDHMYERFAPIDANLRPDIVRGMRMFVVGTGGAELYRQSRNLSTISERIISSYGLMRLHLEPGLYEWEFRNQAGVVMDSGLNVCH